MNSHSVPPPARVPPPRQPRLLKKLWTRIRKPLASSRVVSEGGVVVITWALRLIGATNRAAPGSQDPAEQIERHAPGIAAIWHGQHLMLPCILPGKTPLVALFSRSADAELNARVAMRFGIDVVRGSGGRPGQNIPEKGGARALIALKKALDSGKSVAMIADIPHGTPREAGLGIVTLGRLSGRPIVPVACTTSRRKVLERTWDRTTVNLPFGRYAIVFGEPLHVPADADETQMEACRAELTRRMNEATQQAERLVDAPA